MNSLPNSWPHLADPLWLLLLLALPILVWRHHRRSAATAGALTYSRLPASAGGRWRLHLPFYCRLLALALAALALARPQLGYSWEESLTEGIDIEIALDVSGSMAAEDFQPKNRLTVAKSVVQDFISGRTGDRIGIVVFSGSALTKAPLTVDREMLHELVETVELGTLPPGTAIGVALATAAARLKASDAKSKVLVLVTDGVNTSGEIDPASATAICAGLGIKVYTIGVGTGGLVTIPVRVPRGPANQPERVERLRREVPVDADLLRKIAERTGGRFYRATDRDSLQQIFHEIDQLETTEIEVKRYVRYQEAYQPFAWSALAFLLVPFAAVSLRLTAEP